MGRLPDWAHRSSAASCAGRPGANAYATLLTDEYPPFSYGRRALPRSARSCRRTAKLNRLVRVLPHHPRDPGHLSSKRSSPTGWPFRCCSSPGSSCSSAGGCPMRSIGRTRHSSVTRSGCYAYFFMLTSEYPWGMFGRPRLPARVRRHRSRRPRRHGASAAPPCRLHADTLRDHRRRRPRRLRTGERLTCSESAGGGPESRRNSRPGPAGRRTGAAPASSGDAATFGGTGAAPPPPPGGTARPGPADVAERGAGLADLRHRVGSDPLRRTIAHSAGDHQGEQHTTQPRSTTPWSTTSTAPSRRSCRQPTCNTLLTCMSRTSHLAAATHSDSSTGPPVDEPAVRDDNAGSVGRERCVAAVDGVHQLGQQRRTPMRTSAAAVERLNTLLQTLPTDTNNLLAAMNQNVF